MKIRTIRTIGLPDRKLDSPRFSKISGPENLENRISGPENLENPKKTGKSEAQARKRTPDNLGNRVRNFRKS